MDAKEQEQMPTTTYANNHKNNDESHQRQYTTPNTIITSFNNVKLISLSLLYQHIFASRKPTPLQLRGAVARGPELSEPWVWVLGDVLVQNLAGVLGEVVAGKVVHWNV